MDGGHRTHLDSLMVVATLLAPGRPSLASAGPGNGAERCLGAARFPILRSRPEYDDVVQHYHKVTPFLIIVEVIMNFVIIIVAIIMRFYEIVMIL